MKQSDDPAGTSCVKYRPGTRAQIVNHPLDGLTGTVLSIDRHGQIALRIDEMHCSPVTVREAHLQPLNDPPSP